MLEILKGSDRLTQAIAELNRNPSSPEAVTNYWRVKLQKKDGIFIPDCNWTEEEIGRPMVDIHGNEISGIMFLKWPTGQGGPIRLEQKYPERQSGYVDRNAFVADVRNVAEWGKGYASSDGVNLNTTQEELEDFARQHGYLRGRLHSYFFASQLSKDLKGRYLDEEKTFSRLLGSRVEGHVVSTGFRSDGRLAVSWGVWGPQSRGQILGGWLEEVRKT